MAHKTPLYEQHKQLSATLVDFAGWLMPLNYGSQIQEHQAVRQAAGMFDVSHMTIVDVKDTTDECSTFAFLQHLLANDVAKLTTDGKALYTCMLNTQGQVIDDLIVYRITPNYYCLILNAATREKDLTWITQQSQDYKLSIKVRDDLALIAVQGPEAIDKVCSVLNSAQAASCRALKRFSATRVEDLFVARTGYTGEDGFEIALPNTKASEFWQQLLAAGVKPCGLGARDSLRLEAGMQLYGTDMDETVTPLEANLAWTVAWQPEDRDFIGKTALVKQKQQGVAKSLQGLVLQDKGILRHGQKVFLDDNEVGVITSGGFSPTLGEAIAFASITGSQSKHYQVEIRNKRLVAHIVKPPFVKEGEKNF